MLDCVFRIANLTTIVAISTIYELSPKELSLRLDLLIFRNRASYMTTFSILNVESLNT